MKKRILLVEQHLHRGFITNLWIAALLEAMGYEVRVSFTGAQLATNVIDFKPHLAYFPWMAANTSLKKRAPQVPIVNGFQEQLVMLGNPSAYFLRKLRLSDYVCAWGEHLKRHMECSGIESETIYVTGQPRYDFYTNRLLVRFCLPSREELSLGFGLGAKRRWALFAMDYPVHFLSGKRTRELIARGDLSQDRIGRRREGYERTNEWLRRYLGDHREPLLIIRPHPGTDLSRLIKEQGIDRHDNVRYILTGSIDSWIINSDIFFTRKSTSLLEAWVANKRTFVVAGDLTGGDEASHLSEEQFKAKSYGDFERYLEDPSSLTGADHSEFLEKHFYRLDGNSCYRTAKCLDQIARGCKEGVDYKSFPYEDTKERMKAVIKSVLNESGMARHFPFSKLVNSEYMTERDRNEVFARLKAIARAEMDMDRR